MAGIGLGGALLVAGAGAGISGGINAVAANNSGQSSGGGLPNLTSPRSILGLIAGWILSQQQKKAYDEYRRDVEGRYQTGLEGFQSRSDEAMAMTDADAEQYLSLLEELTKSAPGKANQLTKDITKAFADREGRVLGGFDSRMADVLSRARGSAAETSAGYQSVYDRAEDELEDLGVQEREDIDRAASTQGGRIEADLVSKGLDSPSVRTSLLGGNDRERVREQRRLDEYLKRERISTLSKLMGDKLLFDERSANAERETAFNLTNSRTAFEQAMSGDTVGAQERLSRRSDDLDVQLQTLLAEAVRGHANNRLATFLGTTGDYLGFLERREDIPPPDDSFLQMMAGLGGNMATPPQAANGWPAFAAGAAPGIGQGFGQGLYNYLKPTNTPIDYTPTPYEMQQYNYQMAIPPSNSYAPAPAPYIPPSGIYYDATGYSGTYA